MLVAASLHYLIHWPTKGGYNFVSGPLADITLITAFASTLYLWLRKHNCHVQRCWRLQWHPPSRQRATPCARSITRMATVYAARRSAQPLNRVCRRRWRLTRNPGKDISPAWSPAQKK